MRTRQIICVLCYILSCLFFLYTFGGKTILIDCDTSYELPVFLLIVVFFCFLAISDSEEKNALRHEREKKQKLKEF